MLRLLYCGHTAPFVLDPWFTGAVKLCSRLRYTWLAWLEQREGVEGANVLNLPVDGGVGAWKVKMGKALRDWYGALGLEEEFSATRSAGSYDFCWIRVLPVVSHRGRGRVRGQKAMGLFAVQDKRAKLKSCTYHVFQTLFYCPL